MECQVQRLQREAGARLSGSCVVDHESPVCLGSFGKALAGSSFEVGGHCFQHTHHCTCVALRVLPLSRSPSELALSRNPIAATEP